ncbi:MULTISPECIES: FkbM family methyltransferase [Rhizobium]|uniref:FkbM family methyltransferase n=1 Tax=Rhizobium TaxID=379 RepID=UPI0018852A1A|nr:MULTISPECIES: FkbM family methyltransferase [Rhizobium]
MPDPALDVLFILTSILMIHHQGSLMLWHFQTLSTLTKHWGPRAALSVYVNRQTTRDSTEIKKISMPGVEGDVFLRPRSSDWDVLGQVFLDEEYNIKSAVHAEALYRCYQSIIAAGETPVIVDCGANCGLASIWYSQVFPRTIIIAVEPEPENYSVLCRNAKNRPIRPVMAAISDHPGHITLHNPGHGSWAWQTVESASGEIEAQTIPALLASVPNGRTLIVKIDIEGSEVSLFRSNTDWVDQTPLVVFETHDLMATWTGTAHSVLSVLTKEPRDYLQEGENTFAFSHSLLGPSAAQSAISRQ